MAHALKTPVIVAPTIASTGAPSSALSVIYTAAGDFKRYVFYPANRNVVLVDTGLVVQAPVRLLVAGMGGGPAARVWGWTCKLHARLGLQQRYRLLR